MSSRWLKTQKQIIGSLQEFRLVHLMNVEQRQVAADPQTKPIDLGRGSDCRLLSSTPTITTLLYHLTSNDAFAVRLSALSSGKLLEMRGIPALKLTVVYTVGL